MDTIVLAYLFYVAISAALTFWVGRTLHSNGRIFLLQVFDQKEDLTDSVNRLLLVGFYLINFGYISLALKTAEEVPRWREAVELMSTKIGLVLCVLGAMHFFNLFIFSRIRKSRDGRPPRIIRANMNTRDADSDGPGDAAGVPVV